MKIGLYGDSYGVTKNLDTSWPNLLSKKLECEIDNYSLPGASMYYTYTKFVETCHKYDTVIFLVTDPLRYPVEVDFSDNIPPAARRVGGLAVVDSVRTRFKDNLTTLDNQLLNDVEGWYKAAHLPYVHLVNELFLDKVLSLHSNVILYPCFESSVSDKHLNGVDVKYCLFNLFVRQLKELGFPMNIDSIIYAGGNENPNVISGHLVPEFNEVFAEVMYNRTKNNKWDFNSIEQVPPLAYPREHYYLG